MNTLHTIAFSLLVLTGLQTADAAKRRPTTAESKAQSHIRKQAKAICEFAYPTVKYVKVEYASGKRYSDGSFLYSYKFHCKTGSKPKYFYLKFAFRKTGKLLSITKGSRNLFLPPFTTARFLIQLLKTELLKDPQVKKNVFLQRLIRKADAEKLVVLMMNIKGGTL